MKQKLFAFLAAGSFLFCVGAHAEPGFYPIADKSTPQALIKTSDYVFEFWGPGETQQVERAKYLLLEKQISKVSPATFGDKMAFKVAKAEIARCRRLDLATCSISSTPARGTAFLMSGGRLVTVTHNFSPDSALLSFFGDLRANWNTQLASPDGQIRSKTLEQIKIFSENPLQDAIFFVTNKQQNLVFSSTENQFSFEKWREMKSPVANVNLACAEKNGSDDCSVNEITFDFISTSKAAGLFYDFKTFTNDITVIKISASVGISVADSPCIPGQKTFIVGYPAKTSNRLKKGFKDAADRALVYTQGTSLPVESLKNVSSWSGIQNLIDFYSNKNMLFTDADGWPGMSGGAILNEHAQACAVFVGSSPMGGQLELNPTTNRYNLFSFGVPIAH